VESQRSLQCIYYPCYLSLIFAPYLVVNLKCIFIFIPESMLLYVTTLLMTSTAESVSMATNVLPMLILRLRLYVLLQYMYLYIIAY